MKCLLASCILHKKCAKSIVHTIEHDNLITVGLFMMWSVETLFGLIYKYWTAAHWTTCVTKGAIRMEYKF